MLDTYSLISQYLETGDSIVFDINKIRTNYSITHQEESPAITLNGYGLYYISFNATIVAEEEPTEPITVRLLNNGEEEPGAHASVFPIVDIPTSMSFSTTIEVKPCCPCHSNNHNLILQNIGDPAKFADVNLVIIKIW